MIRYRSYDVDRVYIVALWHIVEIGEAEIPVQVEFGGKLIDGLRISGTDADGFDVWMRLIDGNKLLAETQSDYDYGDLFLTHWCMLWVLILGLKKERLIDANQFAAHFTAFLISV